VVFEIGYRYLINIRLLPEQVSYLSSVPQLQLPQFTEPGTSPALEAPSLLSLPDT
jgi:hypothetical protein